MISRRNFLAGISAVGAAGAVGGTAGMSQEPQASRPNILIFMPDQQQGATILPGHPCKTPVLNRFEREGLLFSKAHCPAPHCCPSRASFMTGLYPSEHGVFNNVDTDTAIHFNPYPGIPYFSRSLRDAGYNLGYSGKWHVGHTLRPEDVGWTLLGDTRAAPPANMFADHKSAFWKNAKMELQQNPPRRPDQVFRPGWGNLQLSKQAAQPFEERKDYRVVQAGIAGLKEMAAKPTPWCVMISNDGGHDPYDPPEEFAKLYDWRAIELPPSFRDRMDDKPRVYQRMRRQYWDQLSDDEVKMAIAHYYALLSMQDALFGQILDALETTGQADNTLVIYCADHGDYAAAHGLWAKGVPSFREAYNIPCAIRWPRGIQNAGRTLDALVSTADFAPTILEAAGVKAAAMSGRSLTPWFGAAPPQEWRDAVFSQMNGVELYYTQRIVMTHTHKYVYNGFDFDEMYDLAQDPHEMHNLAFEGTQISNPGNSSSQAWPILPASIDEVRRDLLGRMWRFAQEHNDQIFNGYLTVALAPYGPGLSL